MCVVEKGAEVGLHILSGNVFETKVSEFMHAWSMWNRLILRLPRPCQALDELIPDWKEKGAPLHTLASKDVFVFMTGRLKHSIRCSVRRPAFACLRVGVDTDTSTRARDAHHRRVGAR